MIDLGSYKEENEIYNKYSGYILTNNSNFNILRILGIEVKYPSILKQYPSLVKDRSIQIENEDNTLQLRIQNIKNTDGETVQEWLKNTEIMDKALSKNTDNIQSEVKENKIIRRYSSKDNSRGFIDINIVNKDNIKCLFVSYLKGIENEEMIIKTIEKSFILKDS